MPWFDLFVSAATGGALDRAKRLAAEQRAAAEEKKRQDALKAKAEADKKSATTPSQPTDKSIARRPIGVRSKRRKLGIAFATFENITPSPGDGTPGIDRWRIYSGNGLAFLEWEEESTPTYENVDIGADQPADSIWTDFNGNPQQGLHSQNPEYELLPFYAELTQKPETAGSCDPGTCYTGPVPENITHEWNVLDASRTRYTYDKKTTGGVGGRNSSTWVVLPIEKDVSIVVRRKYASLKAEFFWGLGSYTSTRTMSTYQSAVNTFCCTGLHTYAYFTPVYTSSYTSGEVTIPWDTTVEKCFLVTSGSVREISMPAILSAKLQELIPDMTGTSDVSYQLSFNFFGDIEIVDFTASFPDGPPLMYFPGFARYGLSVPSTLSMPLPPGDPDPSYQNIELQHWTAGVYGSSASLSASPFTGTPSVDRGTYAIEPIPSDWIYSCQGPAVCDFSIGDLQFASTGSLPINYYATSPIDNPLDPNDNPIWSLEGELLDNRIPSLPISFPTVQGIAFLSWDWDSPGYCRQKLLMLGFLPEDLNP